MRIAAGLLLALCCRHGSAVQGGTLAQEVKSRASPRLGEERIVFQTKHETLRWPPILTCVRSAHSPLFTGTPTDACALAVFTCWVRLACLSLLSRSSSVLLRPCALHSVSTCLGRS